MQLVLQVQLVLPGEEKVLAKALVDTGAQVNLVRKGLVPGGYLQRSKNPVRLVAANSDVIAGGDRSVTLQVGLRGESVKSGQLTPLYLPGEFYEAEIDLDMILSYPWLREHALGVFPHLGSLAKDEPEFTLLHGWTRQRGGMGANGVGGERPTPSPKESLVASPGKPKSVL